MPIASNGSSSKVDHTFTNAVPCHAVKPQRRKASV